MLNAEKFTDMLLSLQTCTNQHGRTGVIPLSQQARAMRRSLKSGGATDMLRWSQYFTGSMREKMQKARPTCVLSGL
jgi:hypothetical protein